MARSRPALLPSLLNAGSALPFPVALLAAVATWGGLHWLTGGAPPVTPGIEEWPHTALLTAARDIGDALQYVVPTLLVVTALIGSIGRRRDRRLQADVTAGHTPLSPRAHERWSNDTRAASTFRRAEPHARGDADFAEGERDQRREPELRSLTCERCGAPMLRRTAVSGAHAGKQFFGCTRFPACRNMHAA